jgi:F420H(2)-dependent quinone reductase
VRIASSVRPASATPRTVATAATKVTSASTRLNAAATRAATSAKTLTSALTAITTATKALETAVTALNDAAQALAAAPAKPAASRATPPKTATEAAAPRAGAGVRDTATVKDESGTAENGKSERGKAAKKAGKAVKAEKPKAKSKSASPKENGRALAGLSRLRRRILLLSVPGFVRDPVRARAGRPLGRASGGTVLDVGMAIDGEYVPSSAAWVRDQVEQYEGSGGTTGTTLRETGLPVVIVTNKGAKTGAVRKTPLMRVEHEGDYAAVGSKGGAPQNPVWVYNLRADPRVVVQDGAQTWAMTAREVSGAERDVWWDRAVAAYPPYAEYQQKTDRVIPVFVLERTEA